MLGTAERFWIVILVAVGYIGATVPLWPSAEATVSQNDYSEYSHGLIVFRGNLLQTTPQIVKYLDQHPGCEINSMAATSDTKGIQRYTLVHMVNCPKTHDQVDITEKSLPMSL
jgi:hypothetical protein